VQKNVKIANTTLYFSWDCICAMTTIITCLKARLDSH